MRASISEEAIRCFDKVIEIDPRHTGVWNNKGVSLYSLNRFDEAIKYCERSLEIEPKNLRAWLTKASCEEKLGQKHKAIHSYKQFIAQAPSQEAKLIERARDCLRALDAR